MFRIGLIVPAMLIWGANTNAATISNASDPALAGAMIETFDGATLGRSNSVTSISYGNFTVSHSGGNGARVNNYGSGNVLYLQNRQAESTFTFDETINAIGFNFDALNFDWRVRAFDGANQKLGEVIVDGTNPATTNNYVGFAIGGIKSVKFDFGEAIPSGFVDAVLIDNVSYVKAPAVTSPDTISSVPLPASGAALLGAIGIFSMFRLRRRT